MNVLEELIKNRNKVAETIRDAIAERDAIGGRIAVLRDELQELNDEVEATKEDEVQEAITKEQEYLEVLRSDDYSTLARVYRRLDKELNERRKRSGTPFMENTTNPSEGEIRQQRRGVGDRMLEIEAKEGAI